MSLYVILSFLNTSDSNNKTKPPKRTKYPIFSQVCFKYVSALPRRYLSLHFCLFLNVQRVLLCLIKEILSLRNSPMGVCCWLVYASRFLYCAICQKRIHTDGVIIVCWHINATGFLWDMHSMWMMAPHRKLFCFLPEFFFFFFSESSSFVSESVHPQHIHFW